MNRNILDDDKKTISTHLNQEIRSIINSNLPLIILACKQKAKFEGWFKFELASTLKLSGKYSLITIEEPYTSGGKSDIALLLNQNKWYIELKMANTNWRCEGIDTKTRPITMNIDGIIEDIKVLQTKCKPNFGIMIFCLFPVPLRIWKNENEKLIYHVHRIEMDCQISIGLLMESANYIEITNSFGVLFFVLQIE